MIYHQSNARGLRFDLQLKNVYNTHLMEKPKPACAGDWLVNHNILLDV